MKALFFSILICSSFLVYGLLVDNKDYAKSNNTQTKEYETLNEEKDKQEEVSYQKLDLVTNQDIYAEDVVMEDVPVVMEEDEDNPYEKIEQTKESFTQLADDINSNDDIDALKEIGQDLYNLDTSYIAEIAELNSQINLAKSNYEEIIKVDEFFSKSQDLLEDKTSETITQARNDYQQKDIDNTISQITNPALKEKYTNKLGEIKNILTDTNPPLTNISEGQIFNDSLNLEISDENSYEIYLNGELIQDKTISEPGNYELKVIDEALNETVVNFTIQKIEVTPTIMEEETPEVTPVAFPMHNWYLTQDYSGEYGHMGLDMGSYNKQEEIYPIADGTVIYVGQDKNGANLVKILHHINGQDVYATYAHMREVYFTPWQIVTPNDLLGLMGSTGNSTGPHLHLELTTCDYTYNCNYEQYKNSLLNPWDYLPKI